MKIALTGATGGIGRALMAALGADHEMIAIVRTPRPTKHGVRYVAFSDKPALAAALAEADVVIHNALDNKAKGRAYMPANRGLNSEILHGALKGKCRLYVFMSSQVVYSGMNPADPAGYREDQALVDTPRLDPYSRLKIASEAEMVAACGAAGVDYLILRPTIVMGPALIWADGAVKASRLGLTGVRGRTMNLVHVDDLSRQVKLLIEKGARNAAFNLGAINVTTDDYFTQIAKAAGHRPRFMPGWARRAIAGLLPSSLWFLDRNVAINTDKVAAATGFVPARRFEDYFPRRPALTSPTTLDELRALQQSGQPFRTYGRGYSLWFNPMHADDRVSLRGYAGIVALEGDRVRVKAGTSLAALSDFLDGKGLALATLPEFAGITAGACFFVEVHGSSSRHFSLYEFIEEIRYLDAEGNEVISPRDEALWASLRERSSGFILTEVTFRCVKQSWLANRMVWEPDSALETYLEGGFRRHLGVTLQWYPMRKALLVYKIDEVEGPMRGAAKSVAPFRGLPYGAQRLLIAGALRGRALQVDKSHRILAPWREVPAERLWGHMVSSRVETWRDAEMLMTLEEGRRVVAALRDRLASGEIRVKKNGGIGFRFSHDSSENRDYLWLEFVSDDVRMVDGVIALARSLASGGVRFHRGKYRPAD